MKRFPIKDKVTLISRQSDSLPLDFSIIMERIAVDDPQLEMVVLTKEIKETFLLQLGYGLHMLRQMYHMATSSVIILDGYCILACILKHKEKTKIIQMWHALGAIKKFGYQTEGKPSGHSAAITEAMHMHRNYDYVLCSGKGSADFFCQAFRIGKEHICYLGLPRIDFFSENHSMLSEEIRRNYPSLKEKQNILYAPTFRKGEGVRLKQLVNRLDFSKYNLVVKLHPLDRKATDCASKAGIIFDHMYNAYEWLIVCDKVITDYSALAMEVGLIKKPLYFFLYDWEKYVQDPGLNVDLWAEAIGKYAFKEAADLTAALEEAYEYKRLDTFQKKYVEFFLPNNGEKLSAFIRELVYEK